MKVTVKFAEVLLVLVAAVMSAHGQTCNFELLGFTMTLKNDCTITETVQIPDGMTLDGANHTITAVVDPNTGTFNSSSLIETIGSTANLKNLILDAPNLPGSSDCPGGIGVLFSASGSITNNHILHMGRNCGNFQGIGILAINDCGGQPNIKTVTVTGNKVYLPNARALLVFGEVRMTASKNLLSGGVGAEFLECSSGSLTNNDIEATSNLEAIGLFGARGGVSVLRNNINLGAGIVASGIWIASDSAIVNRNRIFDFGPAGTLSNPAGGLVAIKNLGDTCFNGICNTVTHNTARCYATPFMNASSPTNVALPCPF